ncbi:MAG: cysteine desulfurase [Clostridia bacterium]|nr:cysteine desulfurase [Clostridia bacterium]
MGKGGGRVHYLDNSATTPLCAEAKAALAQAADAFGNPSSLHALGAAALASLNEARATVAAAIGCAPREVIFTSGGSEANNTALFGAARAKARQGRHIVASAVEHPSVLNALSALEKEGFTVTLVPPDGQGRIAPEAVIAALRPDTVLVSLMAVNNETGALFPTAAIKPALKAVGSSALVHVDGVQAFGKIALRPETVGADLISVSGHKIHAPKGVGALYLSKNARILPLIHGGGQEFGLRSGTESTLLIAAFAAAVKALPDRKAALDKVQALRDDAVRRLCALPGVVLNSPEDGLPYLFNFSVEGIRSETLLHFLESREIYVSSGSACAKGRASHVLTAQGLPRDRIDSALRVSFSRFSTPADVDALVAAVAEGAATLKRKK